MVTIVLVIQGEMSKDWRDALVQCVCHFRCGRPHARIASHDPSKSTPASTTTVLNNKQCRQASNLALSAVRAQKSDRQTFRRHLESRSRQCHPLGQDWYANRGSY